MRAKGTQSKNKIKVYQAVVMHALLYACVSWTVYRRYARKLNQFHLSLKRKIMKTRWQEKISDADVVSRANIPTVFTMLMKHHIRWAAIL